MLELRRCRAEDFEAVVLLLGQLWPDRPPDAASLRTVYDRALDSDRQLYLCALSGGRVVGFGSVAIRSNLRQEAFVGYVDEMVVDESERGCGIGTRILDFLVSWARERGCNRIELDSAPHRKETHAFYEARGFRLRSYHFQKLL
jgi:GNAT superfamily N-acetyltransferase